MSFKPIKVSPLEETHKLTFPGRAICNQNEDKTIVPTLFGKLLAERMKGCLISSRTHTYLYKRYALLHPYFTIQPQGEKKNLTMAPRIKP